MKITLQLIFDLAWQKFIMEGAPPAAISDDICNARYCYMTPDGRRCAVGLAIPDKHPALRATCRLDDLMIDYPELFDLKDTQPSIQWSLHDGLIDSETLGWCDSLEVRRQAYIRYAELNSLTVPENTGE